MSFRIEEKIVCTGAELVQLRAQLIERGAEVLHPKRQINSTYFDTRNSAMYEASEEGSLPRKKIRLRFYGDAKDDVSLEVKTSSIEGRFKTARKVDRQAADRMLCEGLNDRLFGRCLPVVNVSYDRAYYQLNGVRITFDQRIVYGNYKTVARANDPLNVVEVKAGAHQSEDFLNALVSERRRRFSKYSRACQMVQFRK